MMYKRTVVGRYMTQAALYGLALAVLAGCASAPAPEPTVRTVTVERPVYIRPAPPDWLTAPLFEDGDKPSIFVSPNDPQAVLGVTRDGLADFWRVIDRLVGRNEAWAAWAASDEKNE